MEQTPKEPQSFTYLCMSYPNYIIKRRKLSDACKKSNNNDEVLRNKIINFIRMHPDHELRRQTLARDSTTNPVHREMHNSKINDLIISAEKMYNERVAYKQIWIAETEERKIRNLAKKQAEKEASVVNKANKIQQIREANLEMVAKQKSERELVSAARAAARAASRDSKKNQ
jgi:hypothetical protein